MFRKTTVVATMVVTIGMAVATSAEATTSSGDTSQAACGVSAPDKDNKPNHTALRTRHSLFTGPSETCAHPNWAEPTDNLDYYCWASGDGGTWTYLRNARTNQVGWILDEYLTDWGSVVAC
ncbi:hypothetical protein V5P93_003470 [Actinokineospora auranticolor]|uniref:Peptidase inhibitor family I36 n=1 Tax=Actinokineospora auranticolor TaxID=155976 RepID=A0A2S6GPF4_9PSEU|nr:hypothetical protein [Actinokineospora auranticolor]PPK67132.1 hypothetical protein CLV40_108129 [Actinokineospora auranticolor]